MKFLSKYIDSEIYINEWIYQSGSGNAELKFKLLSEQKNFCAYTETHIQHGRDSTDVEHFDPAKKDHDNYFNYYAHSAFSERKKNS